MFRWEMHGEKEFLIALARFDATLENAGEEAGYRASKIIADSTAAKVPIGPAEGGHLRTTVHAERSDGGPGDVRGPAVVMGGARFPYVGWLEFGGRVGKIDPASGRLGIWRPYVGPTGRYLWPSYLQNAARVGQIQDDELVETGRAAGLEITR